MTDFAGDHLSLEHADVMEIGRTTSPSAAKSQLDRLREAYGLYFANSAQRSANKFGSVFGGRTPTSQSQKNPIFDDDSGIDYDYIHEFDQQGLAAQARPVFHAAPEITASRSVKTSPPVQTILTPATTASSETVKVFTLYISGRVPGEYTTRLQTVSVGGVSSQAEVNQSRRRRREAVIVDAAADFGLISPSRVQPIAMTAPPPPTEQHLSSSSPSSAAATDDLVCTSTVWVNGREELEGSLRTDTTVLLTVTETITVTESLVLPPRRK
jgi:hypothetical protein